MSGMMYIPLGTTQADAAGAWSLCGLSGGITVVGSATVDTDSTTDTAFLGSTSELSTPTQVVAGPAILMGDNNLNGAVDTFDSLQVQLYVAGLTVTNPGSDPEVGDIVTINGVDGMYWGALGPCMAAPTLFDSIKTQQFIAGFEVSPFAGCPEIGDFITLATPNP